MKQKAGQKTASQPVPFGQMSLRIGFVQTVGLQKMILKCSRFKRRYPLRHHHPACGVMVPEGLGRKHLPNLPLNHSYQGLTTANKTIAINNTVGISFQTL